MVWRVTASLVAVLGVSLAAAQHEAITAARFGISIDGVEVGAFEELEPFSLKSGPRTIVLKRGRSATAELWAWHEAALAGNMAAARKRVTLVAYDRAGKPVARYYLENAWPSKVSLPPRTGGGPRAETITITCERIQRIAH